MSAYWIMVVFSAIWLGVVGLCLAHDLMRFGWHGPYCGCDRCVRRWRGLDGCRDDSTCEHF